ncbi:HAD family hydrolase [Micromonospora sp. LZ34]
MTHCGAVLFDLDATLLDYGEAAYRRTVQRVCTSLATRYGDIDRDRLADIYLSVNRARFQAAEGRIARTSHGSADGTSIWREGWHRALLETGCTDDEALTSAVDLYAEDRRRSYRLYDDAIDVLRTIRQRDLPVGIVTNGPAATQREKIAVTGLAEHVQVVIVSGEVGVAKPDPTIFRLALDALGVPAERSWYVGDSLRVDITGARRAGWGKAIWVNRAGVACPPGSVAPDREIRTLRDLLPVLDDTAAGPS